MLLNLPVNVLLSIEYTEQIAGRVPYGWAEKIAVTRSVAEFIQLGGERLADGKMRGVDCSGFVRWLLYQSSHGKVLVPDGSWNIGAYLKGKAAELKYGPEDYETAGNEDGVLRIAGFDPTKSHPGHIWCICNGLTMESHGKNAHGDGVDRRPWDTPVLTDNVQWCLPIARKYQFS
ncbi:MAG: hypothetical protein ACLQVD_11910 [Capsulimonadaceae bacterium]